MSSPPIRSSDTAVADAPVLDEDWEEWDGSSPFWAHCVAGSMAGVMEHAAIYPLDTVRTHIQVCAACVQDGSFGINGSNGSGTTMNPTSQGKGVPPSTSANLLRSATAAGASQAQQRLPLGMLQTIRYLVSEPIILANGPASASSAINNSTVAAAASSATSQQIQHGWTRLFRGVQTILIGCIPAHALYFSSYETVKAAFSTPDGQVSAFGSSLAGAAAVTGHDLIMTPLDTLKQRLQIGHYNGVTEALHTIRRTEGWSALYRSFPVTLASNIPYGMVMVATNEACKAHLSDDDDTALSWQTILASSSLAGFVASAVTTPLDRIKTSLQTQQLAPICPARRMCPKRAARQSRMSAAAATASTGATTAATNTSNTAVVNWHQAARRIYQHEGYAGFFRGTVPRILSHTPAVAISWTTYETAKQMLLQYHHH